MRETLRERGGATERSRFEKRRKIKKKVEGKD